MTEGLTRTSKIALVVLSVAVLIAVYFGWRVFWFLTDDAFIAFRYVSNSQLGYGYVWNAPPFRPVEGYTSFLWVVLLDVVWRITGREPPETANIISLIFTYLTLAIGTLMVLKMDLRAELARYRVLFLALVLFAVVTNRTFLAWTSSGLETAMFDFFLTLWVYCCLFLRLGSRRWVFASTFSVALVTLSRPDGLLFAFATAALIAGVVYLQGQVTRKAVLAVAIAALPLLIIPAHLLWRRATYKAWLPNTYYAKTVAGRIWPQSGLRYFASFVIEYSLWIWLGLLVVVLLINAKRFLSLRKLDASQLKKAVVVLALFGQFVYYTIVIGGDHFEYRVYSHLVLLISISFLWLLNALQINIKRAVLLFSLSIVLSWPLPWIHWAITHNLTGRERTVVLRDSVARAIKKQIPSIPDFALAYVRLFDNLQYWLITHYVCMRHQEHKSFYLHLQKTLPPRSEGMALPAEGYPVITAGSVGVISWVLPRVNVIDILGLNDYVAARNPETTAFIMIAHERRPPDGYLQCFDQNVGLDQGHFVISERVAPMTAEKIVGCENKFINMVEHPELLKRVAAPIRNPIDERRNFISQQYRDVLDREPDPDGLDFWTEHLRSCPTGSYCFNDTRATLNQVFLESEEFQELAGFIYRLHRASFGSPPKFFDFTADRRILRVKDLRDPDELIPAQAAFAQKWVQRDAFRAAYPDKLSAEEFVDRLFDKAGLKPFEHERQRLMSQMLAGKSRAEVLREVVEMDEFKQQERERGFVEMQFLLQLRHDVDFKDERYQAWFEKLDRHERVDLRHVICLFLTSEEYQRRFGDVVTHTNAECK
jgi:arabinofuranosyltransferase